MAISIRKASYILAPVILAPALLSLLIASAETQSPHCGKQIKLQSWKGDYLDRSEDTQGITTGGTGEGAVWTLECRADKILLRSFLNDYLTRANPPSFAILFKAKPEASSEFTLEASGDTVKLKTAAGDYLHRPDSSQGVTSWGTGIGNQWKVIKPPTPAEQETDFISRYCKNSSTTTIPPGSKAQADTYYQDLSGKINLKLDPRSTKLDDLLLYLGYAPRGTAKPITAKELQDATPADLMDVTKLGTRLGGLKLSAGDVLAARFFAPKISDLSQQPVTNAGWRKLVLLRTRPGAAASPRIEYGIVLFNFFAPLASTDPFVANDSVNTQAILVGAGAQKPLYWLDFDKTSLGAPLRQSLNAFFDAGHIPKTATQQNGQAADYFVPCGCVACHGGLRMSFSGKSPFPETRFRAPVLDYLDTDHWQDRIASNDDFKGLAAPILFDPGTFEVILKINRLIAQQNAAAQPDSMLRNAADRWVSYHQTNGSKVRPLFERSHANSGRPVVWSSTDPVDKELLPKLNRYCFRCHGSVKFDVFDKEMVMALRSQLNAALYPSNEITDTRKAMPPDRSLTPTELKQLRDLIKRLQ